MRLRDADGDGAADGKPEIWTACAIPNTAPTASCADRTAGSISICGNDAGVCEKQIT